MTYRVTGLDPAPFKPLFNLSDDELAEQGIVRMTVNSPTFPCRVSLTDRAIGETVLLLNHVSHDVDNPYRAAHAIFVTENEEEPADYVDQVPPVFEKRILSLRAFDQSGMMVDAALAQHQREIDAIADRAGQPTVENTLAALELSGQSLDRASALF